MTIKSNIIPKIIIILFFLAGSTKTFSQLRFGLQVGLNMSDMKFRYKVTTYDEQNLDSEMRFLPQGGIIIDYKLSNHFGVNTNLLFSPKTYCIAEGMGTYGKIRFNYIKIPIHCSIRIKNFDILIGPYISVGVNGSYDLNYSDHNTTGGIDRYNDTGEIEFVWNLEEYSWWSPYYHLEFSRFDLGASIGIGYTFLNKFKLNGRYTYGLTNLSPHAKYRDYYYKIYNRVFSIELSYLF